MEGEQPTQIAIVIDKSNSSYTAFHVERRAFASSRLIQTLFLADHGQCDESPEASPETSFADRRPVAGTKDGPPLVAQPTSAAQAR
jgi:hypothetical protein